MYRFSYGPTAEDGLRELAGLHEDYRRAVNRGDFDMSCRILEEARRLQSYLWDAYPATYPTYRPTVKEW
jgi:hypothetical protein